MTASPARRTARDAITRVRERNAWARDIVPKIVNRARLDEREASSAARLAYGVLAAEGTLDDIIDARASKPGRIEPRVRDALRLAAYEILFTDTPASAAVDQGVELVRELRPQATGFANALLRRLAADSDSFPWGDPAVDNDALARLYAHPRWLVDVLIADLGRERAVELLAADTAPAPLHLAVNRFKATVEEALEALADADPAVGPLSGSIVVGDAASAVRSQAVADGLVLVADASAQLAVLLVPPSPGGRLLEIGSGRGTKTALLQALAVQAGAPTTLLATDVHAFKAEVLARRMKELHVPDVLPLVADATDAVALAKAVGEPVDGVMVDAPCSGLGTLRRHPEQRWRLKPADIESLALLGERLLASAASLVKPGGFVVYSTCTVTRRENAEVVARFLGSEEGRGFDIESLADEVPSPLNGAVTTEGYVQTLPTRGGPDGHFVARLRRAPE